MFKLDLQLFAGTEQEPSTEPVVENKQVDEPVKTEPEPTKEPTTPATEDKGWIKQRTERAKESGKKEVLSTLGVSTLEEAEKLIKQNQTTAQKVAELESKIAQKEKEELNTSKVQKLSKALDAENAFDSEALINYIDLDKVELDEDGTIKDMDAIIASLKNKKPNFFSTKTVVKTDKHSGGTGTPVESNTLYEKAIEGDTHGFFMEFLKEKK